MKALTKVIARSMLGKRRAPPYALRKTSLPSFVFRLEGFLLNFDRELFPRGLCRVVERQQQERSIAHRQRDVYETHKHRTYALAYYMTGCELEAEAVTQGAFVRAFQAVEEPDGACVDCAMVQELRERMPLDEQAAPVTASAGDTLSGRNVKRTDMEEALGELPPNERMVFLLRDVEGYDADRVAALLQVSRQQVERTLFSARLRMRRTLASLERPAAAA
jgi:RNA polymerase sigma-70 factor (ECF subfamily)